jgi:hypothetical protein
MGCLAYVNELSNLLLHYMHFSMLLWYILMVPWGMHDQMLLYM